MKQLLLLSILFFLTIFQLNAQTNLSDYSFVVVPESFEFTSKKDQFELNSMAKYYLNKNGFNAFFQNDLPRVNTCDGLYLDVTSESSFISTKTVIYLKDCKGNIMYTSQEGNSKKKEYRQSYQESLRDAFKSFEKLKIKQTEIVIDTRKSNVEKAADKRIEGKIETIDEASNTERNGTHLSNNKDNNNAVNDGPSLKFAHFIVGDTSYLLRKHARGYFLYKEENDAIMDLTFLSELTKSEESLGFNLEGALNGVGTFQQNGDLIIKETNGLRVLKFQN